MQAKPPQTAASGSPPRPRARFPRQAGSAYLLTLLALVVLTIVGLSLSLITSTEMQVGAHERTNQRILYSADSGLGAATARALALAEYSASTFTFKDIEGTGLLGMRQRVEVTPFLPVLPAPCNLCEINYSGTAALYGKKPYKKITHGVAGTAFREGATGTRVAQKVVSKMVDVQPWEDTAEALLPMLEQDQVKKIKF